MRRRLLAALALAAAATLGFASTAQAAPPRQAPTTVIYIDPTGAESYPLQEVASDWSKNTDVTVIVAPCTGDNCIHITTVDTPCPSGDVTVGYTGGCAYASSDPGACQVELADDGPILDPNMRLYITKHEVGHCVYWFGGAGFIHLDSKTALMKNGLAGYPTAQQTRLTSEDRAFAKSLF